MRVSITSVLPVKIPGWTGRTVPQNEPFSAIFCLEQNVAVNIKNNKCFGGYRTDSCPSECDFFKTGINIRYATVTLVGYALVVKLVECRKWRGRGVWAIKSAIFLNYHVISGCLWILF